MPLNTMGHTMKLFLLKTHLRLLAAALALGSSCYASAQTAAAIPIPFATTLAGLAAGSGNTACTGDIPNQSGQHLGDGCLPTQAALLTLYDTLADPAGDIYITENGTNNDIRVVFNGGAAMANLLKIANSATTNFSAVAGNIYTLAGGTASALTAVNKVYYCGNIANGQQALDSTGNGCPAAQSYIKPRGLAIDKYGNIYVTSNGGGPYIRVIYAGGAQVANLIALETPGVTAQVGYIYKIAGSSTGYSGDGALAANAKFVQIRYLAVDSNGNIFASDGTSQSTASGATVEIAANNIREINGTTGIISTVAGENNCTYSSTTGCPYGSSGDGGPASASLLSGPYVLFLDASNNLYITDEYNSKIRVIYQGGTIGGVSNPVVGNIYTYAGGGISTANGTPANQVQFNTVVVAGIDAAGNIYVEDNTSKVIWKFDAVTSTGYVIAGAPVTSAVAKSSFSCAVPAATTPPPLSTDNYADGCPALEASLNDIGHIMFDPSGNFYVAESANAIVRKLSYNNQFPATADGLHVTQPIAFESLSAANLIGEGFTLEGAATLEYSDASANDTCTLNAALATGTICVFNVTFAPAHAGPRSGCVQFVLSTPASLSENLSGIGIASDIAIDTGTRTTLGSGLAPAGVATDLLGNVYVSDSTGNRVLKGASTGTTLTPVITGLNKPAGIAVDGFGDLYVADSGNNRVLETNGAGVTLGTFGAGLSGPKGVAVDAAGRIYVADTGNNRVVQLFADGAQVALPVTGLSGPTQLALDSGGDLYILDKGNSRIVVFASGLQSTVTLDAGVAPTGIAVDPAGDLYVADSAAERILAYPAGASSGDLLLSGLTTPVGLAADADANLFIADSAASGVIELRRSLGNITFPLTNVGQTTTESISVSNVGNATLTFPAAPLTTSTGSTLYTVSPSSSSGCGVGMSYNPGSGCNFTASFAPLVTGSSSATVTFSTNATNTASAAAVLSGTGLLLVSTTTSLSVSAPTGAIYYDQTVMLTAKLTPSTTTTTPTGTFTFTIDGKTQSPQQIGSGTATLSLPNLAAGTHSVSITYSGDGVYASSAASTSFTVNQAVTTTALTVTPVNTAGSLSLSFAASVASTTASGETGTVSFYSGTNLIGSATVSAAGTATISPNPAVLSYSLNSFTAVYSGNVNFAGSTSSVVAPVSDFILGYSTPAIYTSQGGVGNFSFTVASLYGGMGTVTPSCTNLPANTSCRFQPESLTVGATTQTESILLYTNVLSTLASNETRSNGKKVVFACGLPLGLGLLLLRRRMRFATLALVMIGLCLVSGLSGCTATFNASTANSNLVTPAGTTTINVVFTGSGGLTTTHSVPVTLTVVADSGLF